MLTACTSPSLEYFTNMADMSPKRKKTRRGKKKYNRQLHTDNSLSVVCGCGADGISQAVDSILTDPVVSTDTPFPHKMKKNRRDRNRIRPYISRQAPPNSTQFIIDDRDAGSFELSTIRDRQKDKLPVTLDVDPDSFYTDKFIGVSMSPGEQCLSPESGGNSFWKTSPAFVDLDYVYEPCPDMDMFTFLANDFEQVFQSAKETELERKSKSELLGDVRQLELTVGHLHSRLNDHAPASEEEKTTKETFHNTTSTCLLDSLQSQLSRLVEENTKLHAENKALKPGSDE